MKFALAQWVEKFGAAPKLLACNLTREREGYFPYGGIEALKDGLFFSPKYESAMVFYNPPHIFIMSNWQPDTTQMSMDRWQIFHITKDGPLIKREAKINWVFAEDKIWGNPHHPDDSPIDSPPPTPKRRLRMEEGGDGSEERPYQWS